MEWEIPKFPLDDLCDQALTWLTTHGSTLTRAVSRVVADWIEVSTGALVSVPPWLTIAVLALLAWRLGGVRIATVQAIQVATTKPIRGIIHAHAPPTASITNGRTDDTGRPGSSPEPPSAGT